MKFEPQDVCVPKIGILAVMLAEGNFEISLGLTCGITSPCCSTPSLIFFTVPPTSIVNVGLDTAASVDVLGRVVDEDPGPEELVE